MRTISNGKYLSLEIAVATLLACATSLAQKDQFTPVVVSIQNPSTTAFLGTDGKRHIVYELTLMNANPTPATLQKIEVLDEANPQRILRAYDQKELLANLRTMGKTPVDRPEIEFNSSRIFLLHLAFEKDATIPERLVHRLTLTGGATPAPTPQTPVALQYTVAPETIIGKVPAIGPPLRGKGWVAINGCCEVGGAHRSASQTVNGRIYFAQRFAIDWMRLDGNGRLQTGDGSDVHQYADYGADVIAVGDGKVVSTLNTLDDQKPGSLPNVSSITLETVDGNHVVLDLGNGLFAFYAHLQHGSVLVSPGDLVKRGQILGKLGNTGNTSAPHLHFHLMDGPSTLGSNGVPYVVDAFDFVGEIPAKRFEESGSLSGTWNQNVLPAPSPRR